MTLIIKAISYKGSPLAREISVSFEEQGGTIGRSPDNHMVLPDPEKFISRLHARIIFQDGQYFIRDSSTGGTFLGPNDRLLQYGQALLENGQRLRIGEYELVASLSGTQADFSPVVEPVRQLELAESGLQESLFATPEKPAAADFFSSFIDQPESAVSHDSFTPPKVSDTSQTPGADELDFGDLLSTLESLPGAGNVQKPELPPLPEDFFSEESGASPIPTSPETAQSSEAIAKESPTQPEYQGAADFLKQPVPPVVAPLSDDPFAVAEKVIQQTEEEPSTFEIPRPGAASPKTAPVEERPPVIPPSSGPEIQTARETPAMADGELLRQFLIGAGIADSGFVPAEQWPALMRTSGELLRSLVEGLMLVLRARAELKSQFRVSVTTMRSVNNNPLKFTPNVDDALKLMLAPTHPGFIPPKEAVREGFSDIMNHQMAMTAGIQAALAEILRSFDPELIEKAQGEGLLFQKKAKCWESYTDSYPQLKAVAQEDFFGDAFAEAYEKQMLLLNRSSKPQ